MRVAGKVMLGVMLAYVGWLSMEALHELGHVLHAVASGGQVARVELPLLGFSRTDVLVNPAPAFVAWGGPIWGSILPLLIWAACLRASPPFQWAMQFFAGFCLIANGAYLGVGWIDEVGDAGDLVFHGTPVWVLCAFGAASSSLGLYLWHRLSLKGSPRRGNGT